MDPLGQELKKAREEAGLSLSELATRTKIAVTALEALERNDFSRLPGGIFGRSFVRAYALEVGADPEETVTRFIALLAETERAEAERRAAMRPEITQDDRQFLERQRRALLLLRVGLVLLAVSAVALVTWRVRVMWATPPATVTEPHAEAPVIVPPEPADPVPPPASAAVVAPTSQPMTIELDVSGDCWISVSVDGASQVARLFRAGDHHRLEANTEVLLDVGNAGALRMTIDGRPARPLGRDGVRVRTRITRQNVSEFLE